VRNHFKEGERGTYDEIDGKLFAIYSILKNGWLDPNEA